MEGTGARRSVSTCFHLRLFAFFAFFAFQFFRPVPPRNWSPCCGHNKSRFRPGVSSEDGGGDALRPGVFVAGRFAGRMERVTPMPGCGAAMAGSIVRGGARRGGGGAEKAKRKKRKKRKQAQTDQRKTGRRSLRPWRGRDRRPVQCLRLLSFASVCACLRFLRFNPSGPRPRAIGPPCRGHPATGASGRYAS